MKTLIYIVLLVSTFVLVEAQDRIWVLMQTTYGNVNLNETKTYADGPVQTFQNSGMAVEPGMMGVFWETKIERNKERDKVVDKHYKKIGWKKIRIWEHSLKRYSDKEIKGIIKFTSI